jgi:hypothetical protein
MPITQDSFPHRYVRSLVKSANVTLSEQACAIDFIFDMNALTARRISESFARSNVTRMIGWELEKWGITILDNQRLANFDVPGFSLVVATQDHDKAVAFAEEFNGKKLAADFRLRG